MENRKYAYSLLVFSLVLKSISLSALEVNHHDNIVDSDDPEICLTCHNGTIAKNISPCTKVSCLLDPRSSHPVFKKFPPEGKESEFVPFSQVESAGIKLKNGEVSCISCHNILIQEDFHLVMENRRSRLCKTCHIR